MTVVLNDIIKGYKDYIVSHMKSTHVEGGLGSYDVWIKDVSIITDETVGNTQYIHIIDKYDNIIAVPYHEYADITINEHIYNITI